MRSLLPVILAVALPTFGPAQPEVSDYDVLVYGATPAGIAAALAAAGGDAGRTVLLVEPTSRIGGMITNGLGHVDLRTFEAINGAYWSFSQRVVAHYRKTYGDDSQQVKDSLHGTHAEPKVNLAIFEKMLAEQPRITVTRNLQLADLRMKNGAASSEIASAFFTRDGARTQIPARIFIDATYEGDLMARAGEKYRVGREGRAEFGESLAPEKPDGQLQGYNFRLVMTQDPELRVLAKAPPGYRREDFLELVPLLGTEKIPGIFGMKPGFIYKAQIPRLPNGKYDINDVSHSAIRLSMPGRNLGWPDGDAATRAVIFQEHLRWNTGLLYFLQNDEAVPAKFREEALGWGWCRDEFPENDHLPVQLYVREARRTEGRYIFTEADTAHAQGDARAVLHPESIAMGDYGPNCHGTAREGTLFHGRHTGEFYQPAPPYQIPYGVLLPKEVSNLLVPGPVSSSHVGFCALRLEPIWMSLGQAAGTASRLALETSQSLAALPVHAIQKALHAQGAATIYVSDVPPGDPRFAAVQWWGTQGGFHGLAPQPEKPGQRGEHWLGQYFRAFPDHAAEPDLPLSPEVEGRWRTLAARLTINMDKMPASDGRVTRYQWIAAAYEAAVTK